MARRITVTPEQLNAAAAKIESLAMNYQKTYMRLYTEVANMRSAWDGTDNIAYSSQVKGFEDDFQRMYKLMTDYATFLRMSAKSYQKTQNDIISASQGLNVGTVQPSASIFSNAKVIYRDMVIVGPNGRLDKDKLLQDMVKKFGEEFFKTNNTN